MSFNTCVALKIESFCNLYSVRFLKIFLLVIFIGFWEKGFAESYLKKAEFLSDGEIAFNSKEFQKSSALFSFGTKFLFRDFELRFFEKSFTKTFHDFGEVKNVKDVFPLPNYGASISLGNFFRFPLNIRIGTIVPGGSFTQFSSPQLSYSSPLSNSFSVLKGVTSSLPDLSSAKKENAIFVESYVPSKMKFSSSGGSFYFREDGAFSLSGVLSAKLSALTTLGFSFTGSRFFLQNDDSAWFSSEAFFLPSWYGMFSSSLFFLSPFFSSDFIFNVYMQNKIEGKKNAALSFRCDTKFSYGRLNVLSCVFFTDGVIHNSKNSFITNRFQIKIIPSYVFGFQNEKYSSLKVGLSFFSSAKEKDFSLHYDFKSALGFQYIDKNFSLSFTGSMAFECFEFYLQNTVCNIDANFQIRKKTFSPSVKLSSSFSKKSQEEEVKISFQKKCKRVALSPSISFGFKQKNSVFDGGNASVQFSVDYVSKHFRYKGKIGASVKY